MVLKYSFEYLSNNNTLIDFLIRIADESDLNFEVIRNDSYIDFYCESDVETLEAFSTKLSAELPMSIFLRSTDAEAVEEMPKEGSFDDNVERHQLSFCPKCLQTVEDEKSENYYNPFYSCDLCTSNNEVQKSIELIQNTQKEVITDFPELFKQLASKIEQGSRIKIETRSGIFVFEKFSTIDNEESQILCTNLMNLSSVFVAKKSEVIALASIEKPQIVLKFNEIFKQKSGLTQTNAKVQYVNDLFLYLLAKELESLEINFLTFYESDECDIEIKTGFLNEYRLEVPSITILDSDRIIINKSSHFDKKLLTMYDKFEDKNKGHFMVLLQENNLFDKSIINFYASSLDNDNVSVYSNNIGSFLDILNYELPLNIESIFNEIRRDDTGKRLLENYKNKFSDNIHNALSFDMSDLKKHSITSLWKLVRVLLGFETTVINHATSSLLEKGPRIDYKLFEQEKIYNKKFDFVQLIRSGMSFKLAGVDNNTIALGYVESYAHFISSVVDEVNQEMPLDGISLCGDIFSNNLISNFVNKSITKNYKIYYNKDFVIQVS